MSNKPKTNYAGNRNKPLQKDFCQTPFYALDSLIAYLPKDWLIWEPAAGEGYIVAKLQNHGYSVLSGDIRTGQNFFDGEPLDWHCQVTNPPYSIKYDWLKRSYELGRPFALLMPVDTVGAQAAQRLFEKYGIEIILLDRRVNFKMPNKGWNGGGSQFSSAWFTWGLGIGQALTFERVVVYSNEQLPLLLEAGR